MNKIVLILGMHRSGTSFLARWLQCCGLYIGSNLYGKDIGNIEGHYEDWNFINLHKRMLNEIPYNNTDNDDFDFEKHAREIVNDHNLIYQQWSWKDPRTCLLLEQWNIIIPDATAIVIFRHYSFVVDSIIRRYKEQLIKSGFLKKVRGLISLNLSLKKIDNFYLSEWIRYNEHIINYLKKKERIKYAVVQLDNLFESGETIIDYFNDQGIRLTYTNPEKIFRPDLFTRATSRRFYFSDDLKKTANRIFYELQELSKANEFK
jgi:hypothetical protein